MLKLIQPISKKDQVVAAIKEAILLGTIGPGDQIVESRMARQLGSGIPLVREALIALEHQGFVQKTPYKGTTVTKLEPKQIREIFQLRVELEAGHCVGQGKCHDSRYQRIEGLNRKDGAGSGRTRFGPVLRK